MLLLLNKGEKLKSSRSPIIKWVSRYQNVSTLVLMERVMMKVLVTTGATRRVKLQSNHHHHRPLEPAEGHRVTHSILLETLLKSWSAKMQVGTTDKPTPSFLPAGHPSRRPTNSVRAPNGKFSFISVPITYVMSQVGGGKTGNRLRWSIPL